VTDLNEDNTDTNEGDGDVASDSGVNVFFSEKDIGADHFITPQGFGLISAALKVIPEDFYVNEILKDGSVVELKEVTPAVKQIMTEGVSADTSSSSSNSVAEKSVQDRIDNFKQEIASLSTISFTAEDYSNILALLGGEPSSLPASKQMLTLSSPVTDKAARGMLHQQIRKHFHPLVTSTTSPDQHIILQKASLESLRKDQRRLRAANSEPSHAEFVLKKRNVDTNLCLTELSKLSRIPRKSFSIAGTKDKRAVTTQRVSVRYGSAVELQKRVGSDVLVCGQPDQTMQIGHIRPTNDLVFLGSLKGNRFTLALKGLKRNNVSSPIDLSFWIQKGFFNYYGLQRFGTCEVGTHEVGIALINRDYEKAVELILKPRKGEDERLKEARTEYMTSKDAEVLLSKLPYRCTAERAVVNGLIALKKDATSAQPSSGALWKALSLIPRNTMTMYVHAVQSFVWNHVATARIQYYGADKVIIGDTVQNSHDGAVIHVVSEAEAAKYSMKDVVIAMPGNSVIYPKTELVNENTYEDILKKLGITKGLAQLSETTPRELQLPGAYRSVVVIPEQVKYKLVHYSNSSDILLKNESWESLNDDVSQGDLEALLLSFSLPAGTYATMAIRELLNPGVVL
jgi:tRNA pseudouridine13 synthase